MRKTSGAIVCHECSRLIGVGEPRCPYCGTWRPGLFGFAPALRSLVGERLDFTALIVAACTVLYVVSLALDVHSALEVRGLFDLLSPGPIALFRLGMTGGPAWKLGWWWTLFTASYLHGSLLHIVFNMMWVRSLAPAVSEVFGPARAFLLFNVGGVLGFLLSNLAGGRPTIGASAGVFGLLGALIVYGRRRGHSPLTQKLWGWAMFMFVFGFVMPSVNNWAHLGGFAGGFLAAELLSFADERRESPAEMVLALVVLAATLTGMVLSFLKVSAELARGY